MRVNASFHKLFSPMIIDLKQRIFEQSPHSASKIYPERISTRSTGSNKISCTFTKIPDKTLHSLAITPLPLVRAQYHSITSRGLNIIAKTNFPMGKKIVADQQKAQVIKQAIVLIKIQIQKNATTS